MRIHIFMSFGLAMAEILGGGALCPPPGLVNTKIAQLSYSGIPCLCIICFSFQIDAKVSFLVPN